jgi:hypothetical protein
MRVGVATLAEIFFWSTERRILRIIGTTNYGCDGKNFLLQNFLPYQKFFTPKIL